MKSMAMILQALKLFFSTGFVSAAFLQVCASLTHGLDAHGFGLTWPRLLSDQASVLSVSALIAGALTVMELRRSRRLQSTGV